MPSKVLSNYTRYEDLPNCLTFFWTVVGQLKLIAKVGPILGTASALLLIIYVEAFNTIKVRLQMTFLKIACQLFCFDSLS
jgi:hypothetical protein